MPFDGQNFETQHEVFSLDGLIAWLETQEPGTEYDFQNCRGKCLRDQYLVAHGARRGGCNYIRLTRLSEGRVNGRYVNVACETPWTFGAALSRARQLRGY